MRRRDADVRILDRYRDQYRQLVAKLQTIGFIWPGSVHSRWLTCGRQDCACATDPKARHGPYVYWTSKENGRSVAKLLHGPESEILTEWVGNRQELEKILTDMRKVSRNAFKVALRLKKEEDR